MTFEAAVATSALVQLKKAEMELEAVQFKTEEARRAYLRLAEVADHVQPGWERKPT